MTHLPGDPDMGPIADPDLAGSRPVRCEWPWEQQCVAPATGLMTYGTSNDPANDMGTKALCPRHFHEVAAILFVRGLTWRSEPLVAPVSISEWPTRSHH